MDSEPAAKLESGAGLEQRWSWRCLKCEYSLAGTVEPRCPECGTPFDPADIVVVCMALVCAGEHLGLCRVRDSNPVGGASGRIGRDPGVHRAYFPVAVADRCPGVFRHNVRIRAGGVFDVDQ